MRKDVIEYMNTIGFSKDFKLGYCLTNLKIKMIFEMKNIAVVYHTTGLTVIPKYINEQFEYSAASKFYCSYFNKIVEKVRHIKKVKNKYRNKYGNDYIPFLYEDLYYALWARFTRKLFNNKKNIKKKLKRCYHNALKTPDNMKRYMEIMRIIDNQIENMYINFNIRQKEQLIKEMC